MQSVLNALRVLEEVAARQPVGVGDLARALEIPKSSAQRALVTLQSAGWIRQVGGGSTHWVVTTKALHVGRQASAELSLRDVAVPAMEQLRRRTDETVHLTVPEGTDRVVLIERLETSKPVRIFMQLGMNLPLHASANGKAVLAASPPDVVERYIAEGLPRFTGTTIDDPDLLRAELMATRLRGYAVNGGEWRSDVSAVAAAVVGEAGLPVASISVNMPTSRMTDDLSVEYGLLVRGTALQVSDALGAPGRQGGGGGE
ncbi:IclR family transcriptional regulator [Streptomyces sp. NPDC056653]|uniref:IclR family transcriptional regulator n=1 Tax=Streptomyces sp. NPDC056653 TaxID=3345894 RepID=UPI00367CC365